MSETVNVVIAGTPTPIVLFDGNTIEAANQAYLAGVERAAAQAAAADAAVSEAMAEALVGPNYASTAVGIAATTNGQNFAVDNGDGTVSIYRNTSGVAVLQRQLFTTAFAGTAAGSGALGFSHANVYAAGTVGNHLKGFVNVKDAPYNAVGDGVADDLAAMNAAHATGKVVYYPDGIYKFSGQLVIPDGGIIGAGQTRTYLNCTAAGTNAAIKFTAPYTFLSGGLTSGVGTFCDFALNGNLLKTGNGAGIQINSATGSCEYTDFHRVTISYFPINIDFVNASLWKVTNCNILGHTVAGIRVDNTFDNDAGDSMIIGNHFITSVTTADQILQHASSGLKIIGNKLLGGRDGFRMDLTGTRDISILLICNNSIENFTGSAVNLIKTSAAVNSFKNVQIIGNEIAVSFATPTSYLIRNDGGSWLQSVVISGNTMQLPGVTNSYGIFLIGAYGVSISGNTFAHNGGTSEAITLTSCHHASVGSNSYNLVTKEVTLITPGVNNTIAYDAQSGIVGSVPSLTPTTAFTLSLTEKALYEVYSFVPGIGGFYMNSCRIGCDGTALAKIGGEAGAGMFITVSGANIQVEQNSGVAQIIEYRYRRIA